MGQHHAHQRGSAHFKRYSLVMAGGSTAPFVFTKESSNPGQTAPCCFELSTSRQLLSFPASVQPLQILSYSCAGTRGAGRMPSRWRHPDIRTLHQGREIPRGDLSYPGGQIYTLIPAQAFYDSQSYSWISMLSRASENAGKGPSSPGIDKEETSFVQSSPSCCTTW